MTDEQKQEAAPEPQPERQPEPAPESQPAPRPEPEPAPEKPDYYTGMWRKRGDFLIGFILIPFLLYVVTAGLYLLSAFVMPSARPEPNIFGLPALLIPLAIYYSFKRGRRYIGIGLISLFVLPLVLAGSCLLIFSVITGLQ